MSTGQLEMHGEVENWESVRKFLSEKVDSNSKQIDATTDAADGIDDWSNTDWGDWNDESNSILDEIAGTSKSQNQRTETKVKEKSVPEIENASWLDEVIISHSPTGDVLVIAKGGKAVFFTSECNIGTNRMKYFKSFEGTLNEEDGEFITSVVCVPLVSKKRTSPGAPDWTCIIVGFNRGFVRIYTETGSKLISQQFHNERVQSFKVRSFVPSLIHLQHDQLEELIIIYRTVVVTMDGFGLFQALRASRNHVARLKANGEEESTDLPFLEIQKKWRFNTQQTVADCELIGLNTPCAFDQLYTASLIGGFNAKSSRNPPTSTVFVTTGIKPFVSFHYNKDNQSTPVLTEMAYAVASKVKSSILSAATGWLGFGAPNTAVKTPTKENKTFDLPVPMQSRFGLPDVQRHGKSITTSPSRNLSAVTDSLGRVTLIDNTLGIAIRVWKGYRDAECSWLEVDEQLSSKSKVKEPRTALFLVIYARRRGVLEVYAMQQGPKVATFNVNRQGRLLCTTFGMMGLNNVPVKGGNKPVIECLFVDCDGKLFTLDIPFHLGLCDKTSSKVKDIHLLKALQKLLRDGQYSGASLSEIIFQLRTQQMINQGFRILTQKCTKVEVLSEILQSYSQKFCDEEDRDLTVVFKIMTLLELYQSLVVSHASPPSYSSQEEVEATDDKSLLYCLHASEKEMSFLTKMATEDHPATPKKQKVVTFQSNSDALLLNEFFASFTIEFDPNKIKISNTSIGGSCATFLNFKYDGIDRLGELLLCGCLNGTADISDWKQKLKNAAVEPYSVLLLTFKYWCENSLLSSSHVGLMEKLYHVVNALCDVEGIASVVSDFNQVSKWWEEIRKEITNSSQIFPIYSFAIVCRGVAIDLQQKKETENLLTTGEKSGQTLDSSNDEAMDCSETSDEKPSSSKSVCGIGFENISLDLLKWNILMKQIEDLSLLSSVLIQNPQLSEPQLPILNSQIDSLSVIKLLDKGKGCLAELVGRWLTTIGIDPLLINDSVEDNENTSPSSTNNTGSDKPSKRAKSTISELEIETEKAAEAITADKSTSYVLDLLKCLRDNFSVSLSSSIILSNYCWEYCLEWKNETNHVEYLGGAIKCANAIPSPFIRQGMICMMWNMFLSKKLASVAAISKGTTREKLADKMGGFNTTEKKQEFLQHCVHFLDLFMETNMVCEGSTPPSQSTPKNHWSSDGNSNASLTDLALVQPLPNFEMILLHYQLALCAQFFHTFRIKGTMKPTNLFDTKSRMLFFQNMHNPAPFSNVEVDLALKSLREEFLCLVISGVVRNIPEDLTTTTTTDKCILPTEDGVKEYEVWITKCLDLGRIWGLDLDGLRISLVCELYSSGLDFLGLEAIGLVHARDILGPRLLLVVGMRVSYLINQKRKNVMEIVSSISTNLSNWLDALDYSTLRNLRFSKESIHELAQQVLQLIPETSYDYKLAEELHICSSIL